MVTITLYAKQKKRHRCTEQTFGLCGRMFRENSIETCITPSFNGKFFTIGLADVSPRLHSD